MLLLLLFVVDVLLQNQLLAQLGVRLTAALLLLCFHQTLLLLLELQFQLCLAKLTLQLFYPPLQPVHSLPRLWGGAWGRGAGCQHHRWWWWRWRRRRGRRGIDGAALTQLKAKRGEWGEFTRVHC